MGSTLVKNLQGEKSPYSIDDYFITLAFINISLYFKWNNMNQMWPKYGLRKLTDQTLDVSSYIYIYVYIWHFTHKLF